MANPGYAVIGIYRAGQSKPTLMSAQGKVVVFDTPEQARQYAPMLGQGRVTLWRGSDECYWPVLKPGGVNRACIITGYDVYDLPPGLPVKSETRSMEWKHHVHAAHVFHDSGQMEQQRDGTFVNAALAKG